MREVYVISKNPKTDRLKFALPSTEFHYLELSTIKTSVVKRVTRRLNGLMKGSRSPGSYEKLVAEALAQSLGDSGAAIIALDNSITFIRALVETNFSGPVLLIQHGGNYFSYRPEASVVLPNSLLLSWGNREILSYGFLGCRPEFVVPVGSVLNDAYVKSRRDYDFKKRKNRICIVSEFRDDQHEQYDNYMSQRVHSWSIILTQIRECAERLNLEIDVALRPGVFGATSQERQKQYFTQFLGNRCTFTEHNSEFASYRAVDRSEVTVGLQSALLAESLGRDNKVVYINPLNDVRLKSPITGYCTADGLSTTELIRHISTVLGISIDTFQKSIQPSLKYLIRRNVDTSAAIRLAGSLLREGRSTSEIEDALYHLSAASST